MIKNLSYYIHCFTHLRRAPNNGGAPHKPILLLSLINCIENGIVTDEKVYISPEIVAFFKSNWSLFVKTNHIMTFALPFYHMSSEPFWQLVPNEGFELELTSRGSIKSFSNLRTATNYALIDLELFQVLSNKYERNILKYTLIEKYFPDSNYDQQANTNYLQEIESDILQEPAANYQIKMKQLQESSSIETYEEEIFLRGSIFKRKIPLIYENTCCISGLSISATIPVSMIDACHIVPFSKTHDDTVGNGIALCPNLHRAFDRGLITINQDYRVIVSSHFKENLLTPYSIFQFHDQKIKLPKESCYLPKIENLEWHNNNIFK